MKSSFTVNDLPLEERPRERMLTKGAENILDQELIAVVLGRGTHGQSVLDIAKNLLKKFKSLHGILQASLADLQEINGLGPAKSLQLKASLEIARRVVEVELDQEEKKNKKAGVASPEDIARILKPRIRNWQKEHFFVISFDNRNRIVGTDLVAVGTLNTNLVHPRETFEIAIGHHAASIAVSHNHPSGDPHPSEADLAVTKRLAEAGSIMGIGLLDHIIISKTSLFSFRANKLLERSS